ncbi:MAG: amidohydrolase family protein [Rhodospirillales bacterium]|nr:amidohydrolase family protein [Rhodospirillales bacterium]
MSDAPTIQAPNPDTRTPDLKLPAGATDAHCHVFGPGNVFPYHPNRSYTPPDASKEMIKSVHNKLGLERAVIVQATCHYDDNSAMMDCIASDPDRYRGIVMVLPKIAEEELNRLDKGGARGARFSFARHLSGGNKPDFSKIRTVCEKMANFHWHAVIYMEADDVVECADEINSLPVPVVFDHMARIHPDQGVDQPAFQLLLKFLADSDSYVKITGAERLSVEGTPFHDVIPFAKALIEAAPDQLLWGTDWPHPNIEGYMPNDGDLVDLLGLYVDGDQALLKKILVDNPAKLYGFGS